MSRHNQARQTQTARRTVFGYVIRHFGETLNRAATERFLLHEASDAFITTIRTALPADIRRADERIYTRLVVAMGQRPTQSLGKAA